MKPKGVATLYAEKFKALFLFLKILVTVHLMSLLMLLFISCDKTDDLVKIVNEAPIDNETPGESEVPPHNESPQDNEPPTNEESNFVYSDIEPDFTGQNLNDYFNLDLNKDEIPDFTVRSGSDNGWEWLMITSNPKFENRVLSVSPWYSYAVPLDSGHEIFKNDSYESGSLFAIGDCFAGEHSCFYDWQNMNDKYLGLQFIIKGKTHYGWARLEVSGITQWVIKDYAYNATPNMPILAGQSK